MLSSILSNIVASRLRHIDIEDNYSRKPYYSQRENKVSYRCQLNGGINLTELGVAVTSFKRNDKTFISLLSTLGLSLESVAFWIAHRGSTVAYDTDVILDALRWTGQEDAAVDGMCPHLRSLELRNLTMSGTETTA